jgi:hypothetical protein
MSMRKSKFEKFNLYFEIDIIKLLILDYLMKLLAHDER